MIALGSDQGGSLLKEALKQHLEEQGYEVKDFGCHDETSVDYPTIAVPVAKAVVSGECEKAILQGTCFIAAKDGEILGFSCYDSTALDYFGPIGVARGSRGTGVGKILLLKTLHAMREKGYAYAVIGWVGEAAGFYEHTVGAFYIPGGIPSHSAYRDMIRFS